MLEAKVNDPAISKVAFAMNRVGSKALLPNVTRPRPGRVAACGKPFDTSVIDNAKYDIVAYGQRANKTMVRSATITMTIHNPVFKMTPAKVSAGRNVAAPPVRTAARGREGHRDRLPVRRLGPGDARRPRNPLRPGERQGLQAVRRSLGVGVASGRQFITNPATGNAFDCAPDLCSAAITVEDLVMSGPLTIKTK